MKKIKILWLRYKRFWCEYFLLITGKTKKRLTNKLNDIVSFEQELDTEIMKATADLRDLGYTELDAYMKMKFEQWKLEWNWNLREGK